MTQDFIEHTVPFTGTQCSPPAPVRACWQRRVFGAWCLCCWYWAARVDAGGRRTLVLTLCYGQVSDAYPKAPAAARLELIRAGLVPQSILRGVGGREP